MQEHEAISTQRHRDTEIHGENTHSPPAASVGSVAAVNARHRRVRENTRTRNTRRPRIPLLVFPVLVFSRVGRKAANASTAARVAVLRYQTLLLSYPPVKRHDSA